MARAEVRVSLKDVPEIKALIERLTERAETAEAAIERVRQAIAEHRTSKGPAATVQVYLLERALDGTEATDA